MNKSNFRLLRNGSYLVRTQAGFKQAIRQEHGYVAKLKNYPTSYPSVCTFYYCHVAQCDKVKIEPINVYKKKLQDILDDLKDE